MSKFCLIGQNSSSNQRSGMILKDQIPNFGAGALHARQSFNFQNKSKGPKY